MANVEHAWHYTTGAGLLGMLSGNRLWATSAAYMNDRDEIRAGRDAIRRALDTYDPPLEKWQLEQLRGLGVTGDGNPHPMFLLCASGDGDALTLWRSYGVGREAEYAVELDPGVPLVPVIQNTSAEHPSPAPPGREERTGDN